MEAEALRTTEDVMAKRYSERMVLGGAMLYPEMTKSIAEEFLPEDFTESAHMVIFEAISELVREKKHGDVVQVAEKLKEKGRLRIAGGRSYLVLLVARCCSKEQVFEHAAVIKNASELRNQCAISEMYEAIRGMCDELAAFVFTYCHPTYVRKGVSLRYKDEADKKIEKIKLLVSELWDMFKSAEEKEDKK